MKVCLITGYPPEIGSGAESSWLFVESLEKRPEIRHIYVFANFSVHAPFKEERGKVTILRIWRKNSFRNLVTILKNLRAIQPKVVHLVYSYVFYGSPVFSFIYTPLLITGIKFLRLPLVVTIHQIFSLRDINTDFKKSFSAHFPVGLIKTGLYSLSKIIALLARKIIVLHRRHVQIFKEDYGISNTEYIPIGLKAIRPLPREEAKKCLGLNGKKILLFFGFIVPFKGVEFALDSMLEIKRNNPSAYLIVAGSQLPWLRQDKDMVEYMARLKTRAQSQELAGFIDFRNRYISEEESALLFSAADIIMLPYVYQSGPSEIFKKACLYNVPPVATRIDYFIDDVKDGYSGIFVEPRSGTALASGALQLLNNQRLYDEISQNLVTVAKEFDIDNVSQKCLAVYSKILNEKRT